MPFRATNRRHCATLHVLRRPPPARMDHVVASLFAKSVSYGN
jgi:hypothetical protein